MTQAVRPAVPQRSGYGALMFFVALCIVLIIGYAVMYLSLYKYADALDTLQARINARLVAPLEPRGERLPIQSAAGGNVIKYGDDFFDKVANLARRGVAYNTLIEQVGWPDGENVADEIKTYLAGKAPSLNTWINELETRNANLDRQAKQLQEQLVSAQRNLDNAIGEKKAAMDNFMAEIKKVNDELLARRRAWDDERAKMTETLEASNAKRSELLANEEKLRAALEAQKAELSGQIAKLEARNQELTDALRPKETVVAGSVGQVLQVAYAENFVVISGGGDATLKNGDKVLIYRVERAGLKAKKGEAVLVNVEAGTSRADIMLMRDADPVTVGDLVYKASQPPPREEVLVAAETITEGPEAKAPRAALKEQRKTTIIRLY